MEQSQQQTLQNLGFEIANKAIEIAQLRAQLSAVQSENEQLKSRIDELSKGSLTMAQIDKTTQFNQQLSITAEDGGTVNYATLSGSIDQYGVPSMSYYINDGVIYREHLSDFRTAWSAFQDTVFAEADKVVASFEK
ncbi:hypothetical protein ACETQG_03640 [Weissella cibaria]|nr:hypothetical protein [Weissella cibaria]TVV29225.1 hypothetical protein FOZ71_03545 [Weissella cibaria]